MTTENNAAQPGHDPLFEAIDILTVAADELRHGHTLGDSFDDWTGEPEAKAEYDRTLRVVAALSKLRAEGVQAGEILTHQDIFNRFDFLEGLVSEYTYEDIAEAAIRIYNEGRAALASAPVAGEEDEDLAPPECPITRRPLFMAIEHPDLGMVPTYGGPFDSYTIPYMDGEAHQPWHERELFVRRYDHDLGGWRDDESIPLRVIHEDVLHELQDASPQAGTVAGQARDAALWREYSRVFPTIAEAFAEVHGTAAPQASEAVADADPLQGAADWLMQAFEPSLSASDLARQLVIGYNRATRLRDAALKTQSDKDGGDCAKGAGEEDERLAFEAWAATEVPAHKLGRAPWPYQDQYNWVSMDYAWSMWRKIRAALSAQSSGNSGDLAAQKGEQ